MAAIIRIEYRNVYGVQKIYPANSAAECLAAIAGTTTLSPADLRLAQRLGHAIEVMLGAPGQAAVPAPWLNGADPCPVCDAEVGHNSICPERHK
jgi:hypothetical protein